MHKSCLFVTSNWNFFGLQLVEWSKVDLYSASS